MPRIHELVSVRDEVAQGDLHGIVSLLALLADDPGAFEKDAHRVLTATFPSEALRLVLQRLRMALSDADADRKGNFIVSGGYGSGKSHLLLVLYHLLSDPVAAGAWLTQHGIDFTIPSDAVVILLPMNQLTADYLWEPIFDRLGYSGFQHTGDNYPTAGHLKDAIGGRRVFLVIDELERWYLPISDQHKAEANITFLQNLTEFSESPDNGLITFLTLLRLAPAITNVIDRVEGFREDMTQAPDRRQIVLHRLVKSVDVQAAEPVVDAYLTQYQQLGSHLDVSDYTHFREQMLDCYPFHPETIEVVFGQYSSVARQEESSYQNSRGALYLLAHVLRQALPGGGGFLADADLVLPGDINLTVDQLCDDLQALNPRLVDLAQTNIRNSNEVRHASAVLSTVLLHSLSQSATDSASGASLGDVLFGVVRPPEAAAGAISPNDVQTCLAKLEDTALNLHRAENPPRWILKPEVNVLGKINNRARTEAVQARAPAEIIEAIRQLTSGAVAFYPGEEIPDVRDLTLVISTSYLESDEIHHAIYHGKQHPNGLIVLMPRNPGSVLADPDLLKQAQRKLAAVDIRTEMLAAGQDIPSILKHTAEGSDLIASVPTRFGKWMAPYLDATTNDIRFRPYDATFDNVFSVVQGRYDDHRYEQDVMEAVRHRHSPPKVEEIRHEFYRQKSYAKPICGGRHSTASIDNAIRTLVERAELEVVQAGDAHYICGKDPGTLDRDWVIGVPPEEHKPKLDLVGTILGFVKNKGESGATLLDVRSCCSYQAANFPDSVFEESNVDAKVAELLAAKQLEAVGSLATSTLPLPDGLRVRVLKSGEGNGQKKTTVELPAVSPQQAKTMVIQQVGKTDRLTEIRISLTQQFKGQQLTAGLGQAMGLQESQLSSGTRLDVSFNLSETTITGRDGLVELLNSLPSDGEPEVVVRFLRETTPQGGQGQ